MGLNRRNARILQDNRPDAIRLVNDKHATKQALAAAGAPTAQTELLVRSRREMDRIRWQELPESWAVKPNQSLGGNGILLATTSTRDGWSSPSGRQLTVRSVQAHLGRILDGEFSPRDSDWAMFEPLIRPHEPKPNAAQEPQYPADPGGEVDGHAERPASLHQSGNHTYRPDSSDSPTTTPVHASETARASRDSVMPSTTTNPAPPSTSRTAVPPPNTTSEVSPTSAPPSVPETTRPDGSTGATATSRNGRRVTNFVIS